MKEQEIFVVSNEIAYVSVCYRKSLIINHMNNEILIINPCAVIYDN